MKKRYFFKTVSGILLAFILFASGNLLAQNRNYLDFDGSNDYVKYTDDGTLGRMDGATDYTIEAWIYPISGRVAEYDRVLQRYYSFAISMWDGNNDGNVQDWYFYYYNGSSWASINTSGDATLTLDAWNHIAVVCNSVDNRIYLYVNGVDVTSGSPTAETLNNHSNDNLYIGQKGNGASYFGGYIDEVRLKNVAEDPANLHYHAYDNQYASDVNTAALFHFNEGTGTNTVNEASSSNAELRNGATWRAWNYVSLKHLPLAHEWTGATTTDWATTGNWYGDVPAAANDVIIPSGLSNYPIIAEATDANCNNIYVESGATVTLESTSSGDASLIVAGTVGGSGSFNVQRYIAAYTTNTDGWHLISSPVDNMTISGSDFAPGANDDLYEWDNTTNTWLNYNNGTFGDSQFQTGKGYLVAYDSTATKSFTGTLNNADVSISSLSQDNYGWNLLGNPFSSALLWNTANWNLSNVNGTAKIWNESSASYTDISAGGVIPAMQGFMVQATAADASLTIPLSDRTHSSTAWYKDEEANKIKLTVYDTEGNTAQESIVKVAEGSTTGFDTQYDSHFLKGYAPQFYSVVGDEHYSTNTIPQLTALSTIPFDFIKNSSSSYYIKAEGINSITTGEQVYLTDFKTNQTQLLNDNPVYYFTAEDGDVAQRFELHFSALGIDNNKTVQQYNVYAVNSTIEINSDKPVNATVRVYNIAGQLLNTTQLTNQSNTSINMNSFAGVAVVSIVSDKAVYNKKIIIK